MAYLLLGSLFLGIGAMATTVREVQTLSMPATMGQLIFFFLASFSVTRLGEPIELFAAIFPFSSPFAMLARAAQQDVLWQHLLALGWQAFWVLLLIRFGARLFRRNVLKSGGGKRGLLAGLFAKA
jgi:ABC-2 type transport system permease protein